MSANKGLDALCSPNTVPFFYILLVSNLQPRQSCMDEKSFLFLTNHKIFTAATIKKGAIKIFPCGNVVMLKEADVENKKSMSSKICVTVLKGKCIYQVLQPKADFNKKIGLVSAFHWVQAVSSPEEATLELSEVKYQNWLSIPCFQNKKQLDAGVQLTFCPPGPPGEQAVEDAVDGEDKSTKKRKKT